MNAELGRRQFVRKAAVAGAIVWTVPVVASLDTRAYADRHSGPPRPQIPRTDAPVVIAEPVVHAAPRVSAATSDAQLPFTDTNERGEMAAGATALAVGAVVVAATRSGETVA